jgi:hypothetical protein
MKKVFLLMLLGALSAPGFISTANAHQIKSAVTSILFNANSKNLEVMHRFYLHDAEHAVAKLNGKGADIFSDKKTQDMFADYVIDRFKLMKDGKELLPLEKIGYELEGKFFWVYQETAKPEQISSLQVKHSALQDIWPEQVNTVSIEGVINGDKSLQTLTFNKSGKVLEVEF